MSVGILFLTSGLGLLALPGLLARPGRRLAPDRWAGLGLLLIGAGAFTTELALSLYASPVVLRSVGFPGLAGTCQRALGSFLPGGDIAGWTAAAAATVVLIGAIAGLRAVRRNRRTMWIEAALGVHQASGRYELVTLPTDQPLAYSIVATSAQVVLSQGLIDSLDEHELRMVQRHEAAHLDLGHQHHLELLALVTHAFWFFWPARASVSVCRLAIERSADEAAAGDDLEQRRRLAQALLGASTLAAGIDIAALSAIETVIARLDALRKRPTTPTLRLRCLVLAPAVGLGAMAAVGLFRWGTELHMLALMVGRCST